MTLRPMTRDDAALIQTWLDTGAIGPEVFWRMPSLLMDAQVGMIEVDRLPVGSVALFNIDLTNLGAEIGVYVADEAYRKTGVGARACRAMMQRGFDKYGLERIEAQALSKNKAANEALRRAGFTQEGARRKAALVDGRLEHVTIWSMLKPEFDSKWRR